MKFVDLSGKRYGRLVVIKLDHVQKLPSGKNEMFYLCKCDCGKSKVIRASSLRNGYTQSCGCYMKEMLSKRQSVHNMSKSTLCKAWCNMKARCFNTRRKDYCDYGGRGITMCEEWKDFEVFKEWAMKMDLKKKK